jgi:integrase
VGKVQVYEESDIMRFIEAAEPMLADLIVVAAETGMRPHETRELRWIWICLTGDRAIITLPAEFTKTAKERQIEASENVTVVLRRRKNKTQFVFPLPSDPLKPISDVFLSRMWRKMLINAAMPEGLKFHWLRHTFFTKALIESKLPLAMVADYGGNSPTILFDRYLKTDANKTRVCAGVVRLNLTKTEK